MDTAPERRRDFWCAVILIVILMTVSRRLYATAWTYGLGIVLLLTLFGVLLGLTLGASRFKRRVTFFLGLGYSLVTVPLVMLWLLYKDVAWLERLLSLGGQLANAFGQFINRQQVSDPILFLTFVAVVFWIISLEAGYALTRRGGFGGAVIPAGVVLVIIQLFDLQTGDRVYSLAFYIFLCLLLLGRLVYLRRRQSWKEQHVWFATESGTDMSLLAAVVALALVVLAWSLPVSSRPLSGARILWENLTRSWQVREELDRAIASLHGNQIATPDFYGSTLSLGQRAQSGDEVYLNVRAPHLRGEYRYYWRVRSYDLYQDDRWHTSGAFQISFSPSEEALAVSDSRGPTVRFVFTPQSNDLLTLITPLDPVWVSRPVNLIFRHAAGDAVDPIAFVATPTVLVGEQYTVRSNLYEPTADELRRAGVNYPEWVTDQYLQLPADLSPEITALAQRIAAGAETPYDRAEAVTQYLRDNITYATTVEPAPEGEDPLAWFLFNSKTGFCNYYASAEVVMLRSLGIPARMSVGFAEGEFEEPDQYTVRRHDAHAWPEVYFPGFGWTPFEPTTIQAPLVRPESLETAGGETALPTPETEPTRGPREVPTPIGGETPTTPPADASQTLTVVLAVVSMLIIVGFIVYIFGGLDKVFPGLRRVFRKPLVVFLKETLERLSVTPPAWLVRQVYYAELTPTARAFSVVYRSLRRLGEPAPLAQTPAEAAAQLTRRVPQVAGEIRILLRECQRSLYAKRPGDPPLANRAAKAVRRAARDEARKQRWARVKRVFIHEETRRFTKKKE